MIRPSLIPWVKKRGVMGGKIRVIPHGLVVQDWVIPDGHSREFRQNQGLDGYKVVLFVGRLERANYVEDALEIAALVLQRRQDVRFIFLGDGDQRESAAIHARELGISSAIMWKGFRPREEVRYWRSACDIQLCLMGGFSLLEAAASGHPVISYDVEWHHELIRNGETGVLILEHDRLGASVAILRLLEDSKEGERLALKAREFVRERYSWDQTSRFRRVAYEELRA